MDLNGDGNVTFEEFLTCCIGRYIFLAVTSKLIYSKPIYGVSELVFFRPKWIPVETYWISNRIRLFDKNNNKDI